MLLGKYIPMEMLAQMPLSFVHRLRDKRLQQLEEKRRNQDILANKMKYPVGANDNNIPNTTPPTPNLGNVDDSDLEDLFDGL